MENRDALIQQWENLFLGGRYQELSAQLAGYLVTDATDSDVWLYQGIALFGLGKIKESADAFEKAIALNPINVRARNNYASALWTLGRYVDGMNACESVIRLDANYVPAYINNANCLASLGYIDLACTFLSRALLLDDQNVDTGIRCAALSARFENFPLAFEMYLKTAQMPDAPDEVHQQIFEFFKLEKQKGVPRETWIAQINQWRDTFISNKQVFELASTLIQGG